jgi:hypothetical protein
MIDAFESSQPRGFAVSKIRLSLVLALAIALALLASLGGAWTWHRPTAAPGGERVAGWIWVDAPVAGHGGKGQNDDES